MSAPVQVKTTPANISTAQKPFMLLINKTDNSHKLCDIVSHQAGYSILKFNKQQICVSTTDTTYDVIACDNKSK